MESKEIAEKIWDLAENLSNEANECCHRSDGFQESLRESFRKKILDLVLEALK